MKCAAGIYRNGIHYMILFTDKSWTVALSKTLELHLDGKITTREMFDLREQIMQIIQPVI